MKSGFSKINHQLNLYLERFVEAMSAEQSTDNRFTIGELIDNHALWQRLVEEDDHQIRKDLMSDEGLKRFPHLYVMNGLSEVLVAQIIPAEQLNAKHPHFISNFQLWLMRHWLKFLSRAEFPVEFQMVVEFVSRVLKPYDLRAGRRFDSVVDEFSGLFKQATLEDVSQQNIQQLQQKLTQCFQSFRQKTKPFEQRVVAFERQQFNNDSASALAKQFIYDELANEKIPDWLYQFVFEHWHRYFHLNILQHDVDSEPVQQGKTLLNRLAKVLTYLTPEDVHQHIATEIAPLWSDIRTLFEKIVIEETIIDRFLQQLEDFHVAIMEERVQKYEWITVESASQSESDDDQSNTAKLLAQFKVGSWFIYLKDDSQYRCYVVDRDAKEGTIILVNYSGARVDGVSFSRLKELVKNKKIVSLSLDSNLEQRVNELGLYIEHQTRTIEAQLKERHKSQIKRQVMERLEQSRKQRLETKKSKRQAERRAREQQQKLKRQESIRALSQKLASLTPGSTFVDHRNNERIIQFALRLKQSGKLIFVDKRGVKAAQWHPEELATLMVDNDIELLASRQSNEQTMEQIVAGQRSRRQSTANNV